MRGSHIVAHTYRVRRLLHRELFRSRHYFGWVMEAPGGCIYHYFNYIVFPACTGVTPVFKQGS